MWRHIVCKSFISFFVICRMLCAALSEEKDVFYEHPRKPDIAEDTFYDLTYDNSVCPTGLRSVAVSGYRYVGAKVLKQINVNDSSLCLQECYQIKPCASVNVHRLVGSPENFLCELNSGSQIDMPSGLIPFDISSYYEHIECPFNRFSQKALETVDEEKSQSLKTGQDESYKSVDKENLLYKKLLKFNDIP